MAKLNDIQVRRNKIPSLFFVMSQLTYRNLVGKNLIFLFEIFFLVHKNYFRPYLGHLWPFYWIIWPTNMFQSKKLRLQNSFFNFSATSLWERKKFKKVKQNIQKYKSFRLGWKTIYFSAEKPQNSKTCFLYQGKNIKKGMFLFEQKILKIDNFRRGSCIEWYFFICVFWNIIVLQ